MKRSKRFKSSNQSDAEAVGGGGDARAERAGAPLPPPQAAGAMGWSVTPHRRNTGTENKSSDSNVLDESSHSLDLKSVSKDAEVKSPLRKWAVLSQGIDTLDVGFGVRWGANWAELSQELDEGKAKAYGKQEIPWKEILGETVYILAGGKRNYRYHLVTEFGQIYIGKSAVSRKDPNVYISFHAWRLCKEGWRECLTHAGKVVRALGGTIVYIKPSRVDLYVDSLLPGGMTSHFLQTHLVSLAHKRRYHGSSRILETYYAGDGKNKVQLRVYDKTKKALKDNTYPVWWKKWGAEYEKDVWRVEFQIRRPYLNKFGIHTISDLMKSLGTIWEALTTIWCSLRVPDKRNTERRTLHPFWVAIQSRASAFGGMRPLEKKTSLEPPDMAWHVAHIEGCLTTFGAMRGHESMDETMRDLEDIFHKRKAPEVYGEAIHNKALKSGRLGTHYKKTPPTEEGAS